MKILFNAKQKSTLTRKMHLLIKKKTCRPCEIDLLRVDFRPKLKALFEKY